MKKLKITLVALISAISMNLMAQSLIMDENFQSWEEAGFRPGADTIKDCKTKLSKVNSKTNIKKSKVYGDTKVNYTFKAAAVSPICGSKKTPSTVSDGCIAVVNKDFAEVTIGQFDYISKITVGASATGDARGYALYKSTDGGKTWVKVGEYIGAKGEGQDAQYGFTHEIAINEKNVTLKFAPFVHGKDEPKLQKFQIHDIKVYGE